jgi:PRC-barrel domain
MPNPTPIRLLSAAALLTLSALAAAQQAPAPEPSQPPEKPPMAQKPATPPSSSEAKPAHPLMGLTAVSADGSNIGDVRAVKTTPDGKVTALHIHSGGFLGFGGKIVEIPEGRFSRSGDKIQLTFTGEQVSKLPAVKDGR